MMIKVPAEWDRHKAMWVGFPSHAELWQDDLSVAQTEVADLARALAGPGAEHVKLLVCGDEAEQTARMMLGDVAGIEIISGRFGDIWLRDTGPIFVKANGEDAAAGFQFNGWGGKYVYPDDDTVAGQLAEHAAVPLVRNPFILEGGALDHDGEGTIVTTRQCLLNPNRNTGWSEADAETALGQALGAKKVLWLGDGLVNDHTDGHVDNLARFISPGVIACPVAVGRDDPNARAYDAAAAALGAMTDARGERLTVMRIPSPGRIEVDKTIIPASHMNFLIANKAIIVPQYGGSAGQLAVMALEALFPGRTIVPLASNAILTGGGSFHCISQQEPA